MYLADRIALMREGRIVQFGSPLDLYRRPVDAFAAGFFGEVNRINARVSSEHVQTPWGPLDAPEMLDGEEAAILIRPEALRLQPLGPDGAEGVGTAKVMASRMLGRSSLVHLSVNGASGHDLHLHARVPGRFLPPEDEVLAVHLDRSQAFVFPLGASPAPEEAE